MSTTTQPMPKLKQSRIGTIISIVILVAIAGFFLFSFLQGQKDITKGSVGDCTAYEAGANKPYSLADCDSADAKYKILGFAKTAEKQSCLDVAGTTRTVTSTKGKVCMTDKNADPQKGINTIKVNDCMSLSGNTGAKVVCNAPEAQYVVLARADNVSKVNPAGRCNNQPDTVKYYGWGIEQTGGTYRITATGYDRFFCLGNNES